jgi:hypothetical protein
MFHYLIDDDKLCKYAHLNCLCVYLLSMAGGGGGDWC